MPERLQKLIASAGYGSRREVEKWIEQGRVSVNGKAATLGESADWQDDVRVDGKTIRFDRQDIQDARVLVYHKPEGEICTRAKGENRPTVFDRLPSLDGGRWISVGRLDLNTSGLLLFTDHGELANRLMHPSSEIEREYAVRVLGPVRTSAIDRLLSGLKIDGKSAAFESITAMPGSEGKNQWFRVVIKEGRYREVRRLWKAAGYTVSRLKRVRYGSVKLPRDLRSGKFNRMPPRQRDKLLAIAGLAPKAKASPNRRHSAKRSSKPSFRRVKRQ